MRLIRAIAPAMMLTGCLATTGPAPQYVSCDISIRGDSGTVLCSDGREGAVKKFHDGTFHGETGMSTDEMLGHGFPTMKTVLILPDRRTGELSASASCDISEHEIFCR